MNNAKSKQFEMEHTLDPIRPSDSDLAHGEMSYLYGRDPSILAYGQRPGGLADTKRNLYSLYEIEESMQNEISGALTELSSQTVKVYLRLKPFSRSAKLKEHEENAYRITNSNTLLTKLPTSENPSVSMIRSSGFEMVCRRYIFTETFGPEITQLEFFEKAIKSQMSEFISGQNCTIMTYGTTNSGKSYTLQGTTNSPGIIPRGLEFVFANIKPTSSPNYKPMHNCDVVALSSLEKAQELEMKNKLLAFGLTDKNHYIAAYKQMQKLLEQESSTQFSQTSDAHYSVWVSFAEIYNETIYDLLSNDCQKRRPALKLSTDNSGRAFIKGLKTVCVNSGSEAFQVLMAGQYNLKVAATALNSRSSRSHCIFTIKLLKYNNVNDPESVEVSTFAFCDLAGSERLKKTLNVGDRLKEAQNINTSLLVLGRCLKSIYEGQSVKHRSDHVGPFRESKLTRLFQQALSGKERIALIVNVNPSPNLYIETQNVLNFAAIAKKIILQPKKAKRRKSRSRFSQVVEQNAKSIIDWDDTGELESIPEHSSLDLEPCPSIQSEDYDDLISENERLRKELCALKASALSRDFEIRQQMANTYTEMLKTVEDHYKNQLKDAEEQQEDLMEYNVNRVEAYWKNKLNQVVGRKRSRNEYDDDCDEEDEVVNIAELEAENTALTSKVTSLKTTLKDIRKQKDSLESAKNTAEYELSLVKEDLKRVKSLLASMQNDLTSNSESLQCIEELQKQLAEMNDRNKALKDYLNEAKQDYMDVKAEIERKDRQIEERDNMIILQTEKLQDLENQFEGTNSVLSERIRYVDELEEKLERQAEQLIDAEEHIKQLENAQDDIEKKELAMKIDVSSCDNKISENDIINELHEKLKNYQSENLILSEKLSQRSSEMKSLKCDLNAAKSYITDLDVKLNDVEKQRNSQTELSHATDSQSNIKIKMEEIEYCDSDCQTTSTVASDQIIQTSFIDNETASLNEKLSDTENELEKMKIEYKQLQEEFKSVQENALKLVEQLGDGKENEGKLTIEIEEYKKSIDDLKNIISDLQKSQLHNTNIVEKLENEGKLNTIQCQTEHIEQIVILEKNLKTAEQSNVTHKELVDKYCSEINELKEKLLEIQCLEDKVSRLDCKLEQLQSEKMDLTSKLQDNLMKIELKNQELDESRKKLQDKDEEILRLQKEVKMILQSTVHDENTMEKELKKVLKELDDTKQIVLSKTRSIEQLKCKITELEIIKSTVDGCNRQLADIKNTNKILQNELDLKDQDMDNFKQHRDELMAKYEKSLENAQEELNRIKLENIEYKELLRTSATTPRTLDKNQKFRAPSNDRVHYNLRENRQPKEKGDVSDDEVITERRGRRNRKVLEPPVSPNIDEIPVIELSGSESKRTTRGTAIKSATSEKRPTRKKKLFSQADDSYTDLIQINANEPLPSPASSRSLRTRRK